jgi:hypothetical protein
LAHRYAPTAVSVIHEKIQPSACSPALLFGDFLARWDKKLLPGAF